MAVPEAFRALVEKFEFQCPTLARSQYNETQLRREFVDKFFAALGWDVDNNKGFSEDI